MNDAASHVGCQQEETGLRRYHETHVSQLNRAGLVCVFGMVVAMSPAVRSAAPDRAVALLDRYARGDFDGAVAAMASVTDFGPIYKDLVAQAPKWMNERGPADLERRRLAAATFAMEAARIGAGHDWKFVQMFMRLENIHWKPPAQLLEWGCALMRSAPAATPIEHTWQMAALAVAGRAQDYEFLIGSPWEGRANKHDEVLHLEHAIARFPRDRRLLLAQGIAAEWRLYPNPRNAGLTEARAIFANLKDDADVGAEASVRLGIIETRAGNPTAAAPFFPAAIRMSRDPFVTFLAHYFEGQALERLRRPDDAEASYRAALVVVPRAQSASFSLAALVAARGARAEAAGLVAGSISVAPRPVDPWRIYGDADDRFWPALIAELREKIRR
jgi:tetratricopeptide (TPR) repeat protein